MYLYRLAVNKSCSIAKLRTSACIGLLAARYEFHVHLDQSRDKVVMARSNRAFFERLYA